MFRAPLFRAGSAEPERIDHTCGPRTLVIDPYLSYDERHGEGPKFSVVVEEALDEADRVSFWRSPTWGHDTAHFALCYDYAGYDNFGLGGAENNGLICDEANVF